MAEPWLGEAFAELCEALGPQVTARSSCRRPSRAAHDTARAILEADLALSFAGHYERGRDQLSARLVEMIESGQRVTGIDYNRALTAVPALRRRSTRCSTR